MWNWIGPVDICRFGWRNGYQKTDQRGKACADKEREAFPRTAKFQRAVVLLNLQELIKPRHWVCSLCAGPQGNIGIKPWLCDWRAAAPTGKVCGIVCAPIEISHFEGLSEHLLGRCWCQHSPLAGLSLWGNKWIFVYYLLLIVTTSYSENLGYFWLSHPKLLLHGHTFLKQIRKNNPFFSSSPQDPLSSFWFLHRGLLSFFSSTVLLRAAVVTDPTRGWSEGCSPKIVNLSKVKPKNYQYS